MEGNSLPRLQRTSWIICALTRQRSFDFSLQKLGAMGNIARSLCVFRAFFFCEYFYSWATWASQRFILSFLLPLVRFVGYCSFDYCEYPKRFFSVDREGLCSLSFQRCRTMCPRNLAKALSIKHFLRMVGVAFT